VAELCLCALNDGRSDRARATSTSTVVVECDEFQQVAEGFEDLSSTDCCLVQSWSASEGGYTFWVLSSF